MTRAVVAALLLALAPAARADDTVRWVLAIASDDGGPDREPLRHAVDDAQSVIDVLVQLGGVSPDHALLLRDPDAPSVTAALTGLRSLVQMSEQDGHRAEVFVYYSGHADERGLLPGGQVLAWAELRRLVSDLDADVRIGIVDACASGTLLRGKGGVHTEGFLRDEANLVRGEAYIVSSSADEASQESDRLGASFFTYHLVRGLRGAADTDHDGRITLDEAYDYAYAQTVAGTESTWVGAQHPNYDVHLQGRGDIVLTDVRRRDAVLELDAALDGVVSIRDVDGGLVAEIRKTVGVPVSYALPAGHYTIRLRARAAQFRAEVDVGVGTPTRLVPDMLTQDEQLAMTRLRGDGPDRDRAGRTHVLGFEVVPRVGTGGKQGDTTIHGFAYDLLGAEHQAIVGAELGALALVRDDVDGATIEMASSIVGGRVRGAQIGAVTVAGELQGGQLGMVNVVRRDAIGAQLGAVNVVRGDVTGGQVGIANWVDGAERGFQFGGLFNVVLGHSPQGQVGTQMSVFYNRAAQGQRGAQLGLINDSERLRGAQLGFVNIARDVHGAQFGLVNVADHVDGESFGIINAIGDGYHAVEFWTDETSPLSVGVKTGSRHIYSMFAMGFDPSVSGVGTVFGLGFGAHAQVARFAFDGDLLLGTSERPAGAAFSSLLRGVLVRPRATLAVGLTPQVWLFVGVSAQVSLSIRGPDGGALKSGSFLPTWVVASDAGSLRVGPGYQAGLRVSF